MKNMKNLVGRLVIGSSFLVIFTMLAITLSAQEIDSEDAMSEHLGLGEGFYELEELINTSVTVGSKKKEKSTKTPAIVSVFTEKDIIESGYDNLYDLMGTVPGVEVIESYFGQTMVLFRGVQQEHFNNKSLVIIDGHRIYEQTYGTYHLEQIPLNSIQRIEIIRGPGSALYGTNAYTGLINITTKKDFKTNEVSVYERFGIFSDRGDGKVKIAEYAEVSIQKSFGDDMSISSHSSGKWHQPFIYTIDEAEARTTRVAISKDYKDHYFNTYNSFKWKDFEANAFAFYQEKAKFGTAARGPFSGATENDDNIYYTVGGNIGYNQTINDKLFMSYKFYGDYYDREVQVGSSASAVPDQTGSYSGYKMIFQVENVYQITKNYSSIVGFYGEYNETNPYSVFERVTGLAGTTSLALAPFQEETYGRYDLAGYIQAKAEYDLFSLTAGYRFNYNKSYKSSHAPRGGVNVTLYEEGDHSLFFKGLYGLAIRNPSFFEQYSKSIAVNGDPNLKPEGIHSVDAALEYILTNTLSLRGNYFYNNSFDFIERGALPSGTPVYVNSEGQEIHGVELDIKYYPLWGDYKADFWVTTNVSYRAGREKSDDTRVNYLTPWLFNFRIDYRYEDFAYGPLQSAVIVKYVGERSGNLATSGVSRPHFNGAPNRVADYILINLLIKWTFLKNHTVEFGIQNIGDIDYNYPELVLNRSTATDGVTPFYPGRYFYIAYRGKLDI